MHTSRRRSGAALALVALSTTLGSVAVAGPASAAPPHPDLAVGLSVDRARIPVKGGLVMTDIKVANAGTTTADGISVTVDLPPSAYVGGEGPRSEAWQCTLSPRMVCTHAALAPGESAAPFTFGIQFRPGTDGQAGKITAAAATTSREPRTTNNSATQTVVYDADVTDPVYPDLVVSHVALVPGYEVIEGDWVKHPMNFTNNGSQTAEDVQVRVVAHPGLLWGVGDQSDPSWQCTTVVADQEWECVNGPLAPSASTPTLSFSGRVPAGGQPGDPLPVTVTLSTSTPGEDPRGNVYESGFVYATPAYISGRVWLDADGDGQRDADEGAAPVGELSLAVQPLDGTMRNVTVSADGTFRIALHDGQHQLLASLFSTTHRFATPNVGDDATDSDVTVTYETPDQQEAQADPVQLTQGDEVVVDIGLIAVS